LARSFAPRIVRIARQKKAKTSQSSSTPLTPGSRGHKRKATEDLQNLRVRRFCSLSGALVTFLFPHQKAPAPTATRSSAEGRPFVPKDVDPLLALSAVSEEAVIAWVSGLQTRLEDEPVLNREHQRSDMPSPTPNAFTRSEVRWLQSAKIQLMASFHEESPEPEIRPNDPSTTPSHPSAANDLAMSFTIHAVTVTRIGAAPAAFGAFADVWKGRMGADHQPVAIKLLRINHEDMESMCPVSLSSQRCTCRPVLRLWSARSPRDRYLVQTQASQRAPVSWSCTGYQRRYNSLNQPRFALDGAWAVDRLFGGAS
jgi:hypothetical protein